MKNIKKLLNHFLLGTNIFNWFKALKSSGFHFKFTALPKVIMISLATIINFPIYIIDEIIYHTRIKNIEIEKDPIFIIGHWRSGTTYMVNLMSKDRQFTYFDIIETFYPYAFVTLHSFLSLFKFIMPKERPMDKVAMDLNSPQEEDFAIANLCSQSITMMTVFPEQKEKYSRFGIFEDVSEKEVIEWKHNYLKMLKKMTYRYGNKPLLIKSPANTCKIKELLTLFPNAKFINMYRNPFDVNDSTFKMYKSLFPLFSLQEEPNDEEALSFQLDIYEKFMKKYLSEREKIPEGQLVEVKYEEFVKNPLEMVLKIYEQLDIPVNETAVENFKEYIESQKTYEPRKHEDNENTVMKKFLKEHCKFCFEKFGYEKEYKTSA